MLDSVRQNSRSAIVYILFGILIAAFVVSFGPGSPTGDSVFDTFGGRDVARVHSKEITDQEMSFVWTAMELSDRNESMSQKFKEMILDALIERELLAHEAEEAGLLVSEDEAAAFLLDGYMMVAGQARSMARIAMRNGVFDYDRLRQVVQNGYRLTMKQFVEIQQRELLADKFRRLMLAGTRASADEIRASYEDNERKTNLEYVRFAAYRFEQNLVASDANVETWAASHEAEIKKTYEERKLLYTKAERSANIRRILIELKKDATEQQVAEAKAKLVAARDSITAGKSFAEVAALVSQDEATKTRGGKLGWRKKTTTDLGVELENKVFAAQDGELLLPERGERGVELVKVEGFREGDIPLEKARIELAEELYRAQKGKELALASAQEAVAKLRAGAKLADLFPKDDSDAAEAQAKGSKLQVEETGLFARRGDMVQGIGASLPLVKQAFSVAPGEVLGPVEMSGSYIVALLKERKEPDLTEFEKKKGELSSTYSFAKFRQSVSSYGRHACTQAYASGKLKVNQAKLSEEGATRRGGAPKLTSRYEPCKDRF